MPNLLIWAYDETWRPFACEWTKSLKIPPRPLQLHVLTDDILYIEAGFYLTYGVCHTL